MEVSGVPGAHTIASVKGAAVEIDGVGFVEPHRLRPCPVSADTSRAVILSTGQFVAILSFLSDDVVVRNSRGDIQVVPSSDLAQYVPQ